MQCQAKRSSEVVRCDGYCDICDGCVQCGQCGGCGKMSDPNWTNAMSEGWWNLIEFWPSKAAIGTFVAGVCAFFGMEQTLACLCFGTLTFDMIFRLIILAKRQKPICHGLKRGIPRYVFYMMFIVMSWVVQVTLGLSLGISLPVVDIMLAYLILTDMASIIGNMYYLGMPVPHFLPALLQGGKKKIDRVVNTAVDGTPDVIPPKKRGRKPKTTTEDIYGEQDSTNF